MWTQGATTFELWCHGRSTMSAPQGGGLIMTKIETSPIHRRPRGRPSKDNKAFIIAHSTTFEWQDKENSLLYRVKVEGSSAALKKLFEILEDASQVKQAWNRK